MSRTGKAALILSFLGTLLILAGTVFARYVPLTPTNDTAAYGKTRFSSVRELIVITGTLPINVELTDDDVCEVSYMSDLKLVMSMDEQGTLRLTQDDSFSLSLLTLRQRDFHLTVKLPRIHYRRVSLSASSGSVTCADVSCDSLEISTRSGAITLPSANERVKLRTESGRIDTAVTSLDDDLTVTAGTGDVHLRLAKDISCCLKFITNGGSFIKGDKEPVNGDHALVRNGGKYILTVRTTGGSLVLEEPQEE